MRFYIRNKASYQELLSSSPVYTPLAILFSMRRTYRLELKLRTAALDEGDEYLTDSDDEDFSEVGDIANGKIAMTSAHS